MEMRPKDNKTASALNKFGRPQVGKKVTRNRTNSILNEQNNVPSVSEEKIEGKDYINVGPSSTSAIGKALWIQSPVQLQTVFGTVRSIKSVMDYMKTKDYPLEFLRKSKFTRDDHLHIKRGKENQVNPVNFWAVVAYLLVCRVDQDSKLFNMLKNMNKNIIFTSFNIHNDLGMLNTEVTTKEYNYGLGRYLSIIRQVTSAIKEDRFDPSFARQFIRDSKDAYDKDLFDGVAFKVPEGFNEDLVMKDLTPNPVNNNDDSLIDSYSATEMELVPTGIEVVAEHNETAPTHKAGKKETVK
jgi:hypothetical protein